MAHFRVMSSLILKRASASRSSGEWNDDDFDVLADSAVVDLIMKVHRACWLAVEAAGLRPARGLHADARLRADARGRDGGVRQVLAAGVVQWKPTAEVESNQHSSLLERQDCKPMA
jgi:hypothetical protein